MASLKETTPTCNCLWGTACTDESGNCFCRNDNLPCGTPAPVQTIIKQNQGFPRLDSSPNVIYLPATGNQTATNTGLFSDLSQLSLVQWVKDHPYITVAGLAALVYLIFTMSKPASRTRTDITRWGA